MATNSTAASTGVFGSLLRKQNNGFLVGSYDQLDILYNCLFIIRPASLEMSANWPNLFLEMYSSLVKYVPAKTGQTRPFALGFTAAFLATYSKISC